jgi:hypothetical protein
MSLFETDAFSAMSDSEDDKKRDEILKRMVQTPPQPKGGVQKPLTKSAPKKKPDGPPAKNDRPEAQ